MGPHQFHRGLKQIVPPYAEPIHLTEAKAWCRIEFSDDDDLVTRLVAAARRHVEVVTGRQLVAAGWLLTQDWFAPVKRMTAEIFGDVIQIPRPPLRAVNSILYVDTAGNTQTLSPTLYQVDPYNEPARVRPVYGQIWPVTRFQLNAVQVSWTSGYLVPFTAATPSTLTISGYTPQAGELWALSNSGGALPAGLAANTPYYVVNPSGSTCQLSLSAGGAAVTFSDTGTGQHFLGQLSEQVRAAMKLLVSHWYTNREAAQMPALPDPSKAIACLLTPEWTGEYW